MHRLLLLASFCAAPLMLGTALAADSFEQDPIRYSASQPKNRVSQWIERVQAGEKPLAHEEHFGYLRGLLDELGVPASSQMLVFSKTSLQRQHIGPRTPRAIYMADDVYVGFCQGGEVIEISAVDPELGAVFYTLDQTRRERPKFTRQSENCLICHASSQTKDVPGHLVRSVYSDTGGQPILASGTFRINHTSPFAQRWGGWYVTGTHGSQKHLGNLIVRGGQNPEEVDNAAGQNVTDLASRITPSDYLAPHSDLVALLVLEHQADAHNYLTRANFLTREALHYQAALNRDLGEKPDHEWDSTKGRIRSAGEPLVEYLLMKDEAPLAAPVTGTSRFAEEFAKTGPRDARGRSLRDLDLSRRLFRYPCSYTIYSPSFAALPPRVKDYVLRRMWDILAAAEPPAGFTHLLAADRQAIREILRDTLPGLPEYWRG